MKLVIHETAAGIVLLKGWELTTAPPEMVTWTRPDGHRISARCLDSKIPSKNAWIYVVDESDRPMPEVE